MILKRQTNKLKHAKLLLAKDEKRDKIQIFRFRYKFQHAI